MPREATPHVTKVSVDQAEGKDKGQRDAAGPSQPGCKRDQAPSTMLAVKKGTGTRGTSTRLAHANTQLQIYFGIFSGGLRVTNLSPALKIALY